MTEDVMVGSHGPVDRPLSRREASAAVADLGWRFVPGTLTTCVPVTSLADAAGAVLGYRDQPGETGPAAALADPAGQGPAVWFQQMDAPRPQRNRIHLDVSVPHDEAEHRVRAALAAGGRLVSDPAAPAFWVLADPEGNEACVCTWQGRDG